MSFQYNWENRLLFSFLQVSTFCGRLFVVASMKILVTMAPRVIEVWRVENAYSLETTSIHTKQSDSVACKTWKLAKRSLLYDAFSCETLSNITTHWSFLKSLVLNQYQHLTTVVVGAKGTKTYTTTLERVGVRTDMPHSHLAASWLFTLWVQDRKPTLLPVYSGKQMVKGECVIFAPNKSFLLRKRIMEVSVNHLLLQMESNSFMLSIMRF